MIVKNFSPDTQSLGSVVAAVRSEEARVAPPRDEPLEAEKAPPGAETPPEPPAAAFAAPPARLVPEDEESAAAAPPPAEAIKKAGKSAGRSGSPSFWRSCCSARSARASTI
jgi:hypothetical protein